jgi:alpha-N-arabinofuranosidase
MKSKVLILLVLVSLLPGNPVSGQNTFKNPVLSGMNPDPSICRVGDDFYLVTSTFEYFPGLPVYHSKDLVHWKLIGHALSRASNNPLIGCDASTGGQYAPTLRYHDGLFYVIGTNYGGKGTQGVFYVTAENPAGPWSEPVWTGDWYVDPSLEFINDTTYYLSPDNKGSFLLGVMNPETGKFTKPLRKIAGGLGGSSPEGPHFYKINDYYYIMSAEGGTGYQHREVIQRSRSPWGPYEPSPVNPVLSNMSAPEHPFQAIGHADLVQLKDGSWWAVCLGIRPKNGKYQHLGRETFLAPVVWDENGWPKVDKNGRVEEEYLLPNLPPLVWEKDPVRDNFESPALNLYWNFIRNPHSEDWSLTENPGQLRLKGSKINFSEKDSPAFICRRQTAFNVIASTKIDFVPVTENEEAGLVIRADDKNHYDLLVTLRNGKRVVMFRKYLQDKIAGIDYKEIPDGDIILRISATDKEYKFRIQKEGADDELIGTASTKNVSNEVVGGFTGVFIGMYASGNGKANINPADFDWFDLEEEAGYNN